MAKRLQYLIAFTALAVAAAFLLPPMPQPLAYHDFADDRTLFGIPNFLNVVSNVGFLLVGIAGLALVAQPRTCFESGAERLPYYIFFVGMVLTAFGSSYYHLAPDNERLFWDRLPMTIAFMSLISAQVVDRVNVKAGLALLVPLLIVGAASVIYWRATERAGVGNVLPYGLLQGYCVVILFLFARWQPSRYTQDNAIYWVFAWYVIAKIVEFLDAQILTATGGLVSGHTLKHLAAAMAGLVVCQMLRKRNLKDAKVAQKAAGVGQSAVRA